MEKVREYGSYTYTKQNNETSCNCFKWGEVGVHGGVLTNKQCKPIQNHHNESPLTPYMNISKKGEKKIFL
jgi:hypothetical protein